MLKLQGDVLLFMVAFDTHLLIDMDLAAYHLCLHVFSLTRIIHLYDGIVTVGPTTSCKIRSSMATICRCVVRLDGLIEGGYDYL